MTTSGGWRDVSRAAANSAAKSAGPVTKIMHHRRAGVAKTLGLILVSRTACRGHLNTTAHAV